MTSLRVASARQVFLRIPPAPAPDQDRMERTFFKSITAANGTHKTTAPNRLADVDRAVCDRLAGSPAVYLLDVGLSYGVTTIELLDALEGRGVGVTGVGETMARKQKRR